MIVSYSRLYPSVYLRNVHDCTSKGMVAKRLVATMPCRPNRNEIPRLRLGMTNTQVGITKIKAPAEIKSAGAFDANPRKRG